MALTINETLNVIAEQILSTCEKYDYHIIMQLLSSRLNVNDSFIKNHMSAIIWENISENPTVT